MNNKTNTSKDSQLCNYGLRPLLWKGPGKFFLLCGIIGSFFLSSCDMEENFNAPIEKPVASLNYMMVSETLPKFVNGAYSDNGIAIFVDTTEYITYLGSQQSKIPFFSISVTSGEAMFPYYFAAATDFSPIYLAYAPGRHTFVFSYLMLDLADSKTIVNLGRAEFDLKPGTYNCLYFADAPSPNDTAAYRAFLVEQPLGAAVQQGKVAVNFVNLSYDAGNLTFKVQKNGADGEITEETAGLPQNLAYGEHSGYIPLDISYATKDGFIVLNVYNTAGLLLATSGIPASDDGHSFEVITQGFLQTQNKKIPTGLLNGKAKYTNFAISPNFRTLVRQTY